MKVLLRFMYLFISCGAAVAFIEKLVDLGQNATLDCEVNVKNIFWFLMKLNSSTVYILHSYSSRHLIAQYGDKTLEKKYSVQYNSRLFIQNISTAELGIYFCVHTVSALPPNISSGIKLFTQHHSAGPPEIEFPENQNKQLQNQIAEQNEEISRLRKYLIITGIISFLAVVAVTVLTVWLCRRPPQPRPPDSDLQQYEDSSEVQYSVIDHSRSNGRVRMSHIDSTYAMVQLPKPEPMTSR